jgi:hypothetical protein
MLRLNITDFERWGKLVKTWATGSNTYLQDGYSYPVPQTLHELKDQMARAQAGTVPDNIQSVRFVPSNDDTALIIYLPPATAITEAEAMLRKTGVYPLPPFYKEAWQEKDPSITDLEKFNAQRIGEYTINYCQ